MRLILRKWFFIPALSLLCLVLAIFASQLDSDTPAYAYLINDWEVVTPTRPPPPPGPTPLTTPITLGGPIYDFRNPTFYLVSLPDGNTVRRFYEVEAWVEDITVAPNLQLGFIVGGNNPFRQTGNILQLVDGRVRHFSFNERLREPNVWSPDSKYVTVGIDNTCACDRNNFITDLGIVDVGSGELHQLTTGERVNQDYRAVAWSPDRSALAYVTGTVVKLIFVSGGQPKTLFDTPTDGSVYIRWLPDRQHIAVLSMSRESEIWFVDIQSAAITFHYTLADTMESCWSPKTNHFIAVTQTTFNLITPDGSQPLDVSFVDPSIWQQKTAYYDACTWSPDAKKLVLIARDPSVSAPLVYLINFERHDVSLIRINRPARFLIPYWSPDSRMLALKTYRPFLNSGDTYIYGTSTSAPEQIMYRTHANFLTWLPNPN